MDMNDFEKHDTSKHLDFIQEMLWITLICSACLIRGQSCCFLRAAAIAQPARSHHRHSHTEAPTAKAIHTEAVTVLLLTFKPVARRQLLERNIQRHNVDKLHLYNYLVG